MKKGFTIIEVSILFVIFLIVALLVAPMSLDDTVQAKNTSKWRSVQDDFNNIFYSINTAKEDEEIFDFKEHFNYLLSSEIKGDIEPYKIVFMNGTFPNITYRFGEFKQTQGNAVVATKLFDSPHENQLGVLMYDVNGSMGPNTWGKDVFGFNIYEDKFEPFCKNNPITTQKQDCSKNGTGLCCSNYYLIGGSFDD